MINSKIRNLFHYMAPAILTNACIALFTIVDGIFVGQGIGSDALGAVNIALPLVLGGMAMNMLTGIGGVTITAIRFGRGDEQGANLAFLHSLTINAIVAAVFTIICTLATEPLARLMGADEIYLPMVKDYIFWWGLFAIPNALSFLFQSFCRNDNAPGLAAASTVAGTTLNIFLDWLFVFPLHMGVMGAALATGISQTVQMLIVLSHFLLKKGRLRIMTYQPDAKLYRKILLRGLPEMIAQFATPVTTLCMNRVLLANLGGAAINAYSIISYISSLTMSMLSGASEGMQPLFGQSYGAKDGKGLHWYLRAGAYACLVGSSAVVALCIGFDHSICTLFAADAATLSLTDHGLPRYIWAFIVAGLNVMISAYLYSTKRSSYAIALNVVRSLVLNTLIIIGLSAVFGGGIVWFTFGISECVVLIFAVILLRISERNGIEYK